jgi:uracil-DNA glycosylase
MIYDHVPPQLPREFPARIAFVGEAPGINEMEEGIPLVGSSGNVFNSILRTANLSRSEFHITNVFDEKIPEKNDLKLSGWTAPAEVAKQGGFNDLPPIGAAGYLRPEYRHHLDRLRSELEDTKPSIIVPLGGTALWAFTGDAGIASQRGAIQPATLLVPGVKLLPTFHPAFVLRTWKLFSVVTADIIRAYKESAYRDIRLPKRELLIEPTVEEFRDYLPRLVNSDLLSVDIETGWGLITNIGFAPDREHAINVPFVDLRTANKSFYSLEDEMEIWKMVQYVLEHPVPKLGQNFGAYDAYWIIKRHGIKPRNYRHDTRLIHHNLYPELPKDLEFMGASYTEQGAWKTWGRKADKREN